MLLSTYNQPIAYTLRSKAVTVYMSNSFHHFNAKLFSVHFIYIYIQFPCIIYHRQGRCVATERFGSKIIVSLLV